MSLWGHVVAGVCDLVVDAPSEPAAAFGGQWRQITGGAGVGWHWAGGNWQPAPEPDPPPWEWYIDIGPFFDRFGAAKMAVLSSADALVRALVQDVMSRKWVDLQRADVASGIDLLISKAISGVDGTLKTAVMTTPVAEHENSALRRLYF